MTTIETIAIEHLHLVIGGAGEPPAAPAPESADERAARLEEKFQEKEAFTRWEKSHPFSAFICQGDRSCMR